MTSGAPSMPATTGIEAAATISAYFSRLNARWFRALRASYHAI
jgi:hypothetical protein